MDNQSATPTQQTNTISKRQGPADSELPIMISPSYPGQPLLEAFGELRADIETLVARVGGVLLRGFDVPSVDDFQRFRQAFIPRPSIPLINIFPSTMSRPTPASGR